MPHVDYGTDTECVADLTYERREVSGAEMMGQAMARRLTTPRGTLIQSADYGYDLRQYLKAATPSPSTINGSVENEILKDERVADVTAETTFANGTLDVNVTGVGAEGPFDLTISIGDVTVELLHEGT